MSDEVFVELIFEDKNDVDAILNDRKNSRHESILEYGLSRQKFLYLDYKGEQDQEITSFILDYEFDRNLELASGDELEELDDFEYEFLPDKVMETNRILSQNGYGLFAYPTSGDFYALFISKLENRERLEQVELLHGEHLPPEEKGIQYYHYDEEDMQ
ncbi:DUF6630 family protein [Paenibacillus tengchongensis]|uniref:DUF6630 family protein n=1 Tax=Paenibacillus tengchongensis TaxID=2608684 RepID=UPI00124C746F|nr:hypothetical protein [Paenibacillus tengchongensis]